jgi:NAD+ diphosphatase
VHFLGMLGDEACWAVDVPHGEDPSYGAASDLYTFYGRTSEVEWALAGRAVQLTEWARTHRFCGRCGTPTVPSDNDRSMKCPACGLLAYPRLAPAMITLVTKGPRAGPAGAARTWRAVPGADVLLPRRVRRGRRVAGACRDPRGPRRGRVLVGNVQYRGSQPWPFPHSLMIGFRAEWEAGDIVCDPSEIVDAQWYGAMSCRPFRRASPSPAS